MRGPSRRITVVLALSLVIASACGTESTTTPGGGALTDTGPATDALAPDSAAADTKLADTAVIDTTEGDATAAADAGVEAGGLDAAAADGAAGDTTADDAGGGAPSITLSAPCKTNAACNVEGVSGAACVGDTVTGAFCGSACAVDADCPADFVCTKGVDVDGKDVQQCAPKSKQHKCSKWAIDKKAATFCSDGSGKCVGEITCKPDGDLQACTAATPSAEKCDGLDNDCSGQPDDGADLCKDDNACTDDSCGGAKGCVFAPNTAKCDDADACTESDACLDGKCGGAAKDCNDSNPCTVDTCDPVKGCAHALAQEATACDDGDACVTDGKCVQGVCKGKPVDCDDGDTCTTDACDAKTGDCTHTPVVDCAKKIQPLPFSAGFKCKDPASALWTFTNAATGPIWAIDATPAVPGFKSADCSLNFNDGTNFACAGSATKVEGFATGPAVDLKGASKPTLKFQLSGSWESGSYDNLRVQITEEGQDAWTDIGSLLNHSGSTWEEISIDLTAHKDKAVRLRLRFWTTDCIANTGSGPFVDDWKVYDASCKNDAACDDGNGCTTDTCDLATGNCKAVAAPGLACDDSDACTEKDICDDKAACKGTPAVAKACDDGNACTEKDTCDDKAACKGTPTAGKSCDDGLICTVSDACDAGGACKGGGAKCDDKNDCTTDACDAKTGACTTKPATGVCSDGDPCTLGESCDDKGVCTPAKNADCDDGDACTTDSCDKATGLCVHKAVPGCIAKCTKDAACQDGNFCTVGKCDVAKGTCSFSPGNENKACGNGMMCAAGACAAVPAKGWAVKVAGHPWSYHHCALLADKTVTCWGRNNYGQIGHGKTSTADVKVPEAVAGLKDILDVEVGQYHSCAIRSDKKVVCWGSNSNAQLGDGKTTHSIAPVEVVGVSDATSLALGGYFSCALHASGKVSCWGANYDGQLGGGNKDTTTSVVPVKDMADVTAISAGAYSACALRKDGGVWCWGANSNHMIAETPTSDDILTPARNDRLGLVSSMDLGYYHMCGVLKNGGVRCTGRNTYGELGAGKASSALDPKPQDALGISSAVAFSGGYYHSVALMADGRARAWGYNNYGQLGDGTKITQPAPVAMKYLKDLQQVVASRDRTCVLRKDGGVWCTGYGSYGALGDDSTTSKAGFVRVIGGKCASDETCQDDNACTKQGCDQGTSMCTSAFQPAKTACSDADACTDGDTCDAAGVCTATPKKCDDGDPCTLDPVCIAGSCFQAAKVDCDDANTCTTDSCDSKTGACKHVAIAGCTVKCTKDSECGDGNPCTTDTCAAGQCAHKAGSEGQVCGTGAVCQAGACKGTGKGWAKQISMHPYGYHACALRNDGRVSCWGRNGQGEVGDGTTTTAKKPIEVKDLNGVTAVAAGYQHTCVLKDTGAVFCWGDNIDGQLGNGTTSDSKAPVEVKGLPGIKAIAAGGYHNCAIALNGGVWCWGQNYYGQIGLGGTSTADVPLAQAVPGVANAVAIEAGQYNTCALLKNGTTWCWGRNSNNETADGSTSNVTDATERKGLAGAVSIALAYDHACATLGDGTTHCVGANAYGKIGNGETSGTQADVYAVKPVTNAIRVGLGRYHSLNLLADGTAIGWGYNNYGQLGDGTKDTSLKPIALKYMTKLVQVVGGYYNTCVLRQDGGVWCSGYNTYGLLGDGTTTHDTIFKRVDHGACVQDAECGNANLCFKASCDAGKCALAPQEGAQCDDGDACTIGDACDKAGACLSKPKSCDDANPCTVGITCDSKTGACGSVAILDCSDGDPCTIDACSAKDGTCTHKIDPNCTFKCKSDAECADTNSCTADKCDVGSGKCSHSPTNPGAVCAAASTCDAAGACSPVAKGWARKLASHPYSYFVCALRNDGRVSCWGNSLSYQTGAGTTTDQKVPAEVKGLTDVVDLEVGYRHACAIDANAAVWCWGESGDLQTGSGTTTDLKEPTKVAGLPPVKALAAGYNFTCALAKDSSVWCWGDNSSGQLGQGTSNSTDVAVPTVVPGLANVVSIDAGYKHTCARHSDATVSCWGYNTYYQAAPDSSANVLTPTAYESFKGATEIATGYGLTCGLYPGGTAKCAGYNTYGQAGVGSTTSPIKPATAVVGATGLAQLAPGYYDSWALAADGQVWSVGQNGYGQAGNGTTTALSTPVKMQGGTDAIQVSALYKAACLLKKDGSVWCLGYNADGPLGNGTTTNSKVLVKVTGSTP